MEERKLPEKAKEERVVYYEEDEIDLYELWLVLKKIWKVIILSIFLFISAGIVYILLSTPLYKTQVYIKNQEAGGKPNVNLTEVIGLLKAKYTDNLEIKKGYFLENYGAYVENISQVSAEKKEKANMISIKILSLSDESNNKLITDIMNFLRENYSIRLENYIKSIQKKIAEKENQIKTIKNIKIPQLQLQKEFLEKENIPLLKEKLSFYKTKLKKIDELINSYRESIKSYEQTVQNLSKSAKNPNLSDSALLMILTQIAQYEGLINNLTNKIKDKEIEKDKIEKEIIPGIEKEIKNIRLIKIKEIENQIEQAYKTLEIVQHELELLKLKLSPPLTEDFKITEEISSEKPVKPKKTLILAAATISGLFLGVFLAFFLEWIENAKRRHQR
ncbi:Wzz/FepE/Etk N-terminal domain-containing protein [Persephonella sp.]